MSMKFSLEIDIGNAAFDEGNAGFELGDILSSLAGKMTDHDGSESTGHLRDSNGNKVGTWAIAEEKPNTKKPRFYYMEFASSDTVYVWQLDEATGEMKTVVLHDRLAGRTAKDAARKALVQRGHMKAPDKGPNGGWLYHDDVELFQL